MNNGDNFFLYVFVHIQELRVHTGFIHGVHGLSPMGYLFRFLYQFNPNLFLFIHQKWG